MNLREVLRAMLKRWWLVVGAMAIALGAAGTLTMLAVPQYATTLTFFVTTPNDEAAEVYQSDVFLQQRVESYTGVLTGDRLAHAVAASGFGLSVPEIQARIHAEAVPGTVLVEVIVTDSDPARSKRLATELATRFATFVAALETLPGEDDPGVKVAVVGGPALGAKPVSPQPLRSLGVAALLGLLAGAAGAALRDRHDVTVRTAGALEGITGVPTLAVIAFDAGARGMSLVAGEHVGTPYAESFRQLRTRPQFADLGHGLKVIAVTSSTAEQGKRVTAANLALTFAEAGWRVLLVEADLRRPRLAGYLGIERAIGLTDILVGGADPNDAIVRYGQNSLYVLPGGSPSSNPKKLLDTETMRSLLERLRREFDVVLLDTPPMLPASGAAVLAARSDAAVLVVQAGRTPEDKIRTAMADLRAVGAHVLGCVLTMAPPSVPAGHPSKPYPTRGRQPRRTGASRVNPLQADKRRQNGTTAE